MTTFQNILNKTLEELRLTEATAAQKVSRVSELLATLENIAELSDNVKREINEQICEWALHATVPEIYKKIEKESPDSFSFAVLGTPENMMFTSKGLLAPGMVSSKFTNLVPLTIWDAFRKPEEILLHQVYYLMNQSILRIYLNDKTYGKLSSDFLKILNTNRKPLIQPISKFSPSILEALDHEIINIYKY